MKIAIDIDEVLRETVEGFCKYLNCNHGRNLSFDDFNVYDISKVLEVSSEKAYKLLDEYFLSEDFKSVGVVSGSKEIISILSESYELIALTASPNWMKDINLEFLNKHFPNFFSDLIFSGECYKYPPVKTKDEICKDLGINLIVEDSVFSQEYAQNGLEVLLLDKPWNRDLSHENITRCNDWQDILNEIKEKVK